MPGGGNWRRGGESRHGAGRGGNGRFFDYGELRHVVLALLEEQPRHGYDIIRAIDQRTGGAYCPSPGVIYPTLALLQDVGHVRAETADGARNRYQITTDGRAFLAENKSLVDDLLSRMRRVGAAIDAAAQRVRALRNKDEP